MADLFMSDFNYPQRPFEGNQIRPKGFIRAGVITSDLSHRILTPAV
jgi:hypothetical protein